tara:strand:- start:48 stop:269 length:222 start_codon:yes stop_codon:yes gene_type:complete
MQYGLTIKQLKILKYIKAYILKNSVAPSYDEIKKATKLNSKSSVNKYIIALEERGWIARIPARARSIRLLKSI